VFGQLALGENGERNALTDTPGHYGKTVRCAGEEKVSRAQQTVRFSGIVLDLFARFGIHLTGALGTAGRAGLILFKFRRTN